MHGVHRFAHFVLVGVGDQQDGFFAVIDLAVGKAGLIGHDHLDVVFAGNVGSSDYGEFAPVDCAIEADGADESAGNGAAHRGAVPHAFTLDVVDVARGAPQLIHAFLARDGGADDAVFRRRAHGWGSAKRRTG